MSDNPSISSMIALTSSYECKDNQLLVRIRVQNNSPDKVFVFDQLWKFDAAKQRIADPRKAYRFERNDSLRLLLGAAPLPRMKSTMYRNVPHVTPVAAGESHAREISLAVPVDEYSVYFLDVDKSSCEEKLISKVDVLVHYLVATDDLQTEPSSVDSSAVEIKNPVFALANAKLLHTSIQGAQFAVLRRQGAFDRFNLPGEMPEPMMLS